MTQKNSKKSYNQAKQAHPQASIHIQTLKQQYSHFHPSHTHTQRQLAKEVFKSFMEHKLVNAHLSWENFRFQQAVCKERKANAITLISIYIQNDTKME